MKRQAGITIFGMAIVAFLVVFFTLLILTLVPPYLNDYKIKSDLANLKAQPQAGQMSRAEIQDALERRFEIDEVSHVRLHKDMVVTNTDGGKEVRITYHVKVPLIYNISAWLDFDDHTELSGH